MKYFEITSNGYIVAFGKGMVGEEIQEEKYLAIREAAKTMPTAQVGHFYRLRADTLKWELVEVAQDEPTAEDKAEAYDILMGEDGGAE